MKADLWVETARARSPVRGAHGSQRGNGREERARLRAVRVDGGRSAIGGRHRKRNGRRRSVSVRDGRRRNVGTGDGRRRRVARTEGEVLGRGMDMGAGNVWNGCAVMGCVMERDGWPCDTSCWCG